ncbi:uncharacterized protein LOC122011959 isoform X2 [Zingiber officinale]|uniref:uncharacterized protein LOC122011959 isoform X2 n=1 Tax=Zingiber officinale TaxID=94328 RepID=UPI001C4AA1A5|nr:uncharacterized protein LOC122011959 isoform X2 [Zingiber officinale]
MATKPLTNEAIAMTEKKMDMALDDIIKMSKKNAARGKRPPRPPIKNQGFQYTNPSQGNTRAQHFIDSRSSIRQGVLATRRSNFHGNQFPVTTEMARKSVGMPIRSRMMNQNGRRTKTTGIQRKVADVSSIRKDKVVAKKRPQTLDALFANMKEQRMKFMNQKMNHGISIPPAQRHVAPRQQQQQGRAGPRGGGPRRQFGNFAK